MQFLPLFFITPPSLLYIYLSLSLYLYIHIYIYIYSIAYLSEICVNANNVCFRKYHVPSVWSNFRDAVQPNAPPPKGSTPNASLSRSQLALFAATFASTGSKFVSSQASLETLLLESLSSVPAKGTLKEALDAYMAYADITAGMATSFLASIPDCTWISSELRDRFAPSQLPASMFIHCFCSLLFTGVLALPTVCQPVLAILAQLVSLLLPGLPVLVYQADKAVFIPLTPTSGSLPRPCGWRDISMFRNATVVAFKPLGSLFHIVPVDFSETVTRIMELIITGGAPEYDEQVLLQQARVCAFLFHAVTPDASWGADVVTGFDSQGRGTGVASLFEQGESIIMSLKVIADGQERNLPKEIINVGSKLDQSDWNEFDDDAIVRATRKSESFLVQDNISIQFNRPYEKSKKQAVIVEEKATHHNGTMKMLNASLRRHQFELLHFVYDHSATTPIHIIYSTPTGSGKTLTALLLHLQVLRAKNDGKILVYACPTKTVLKRVGMEAEGHCPHYLKYWTMNADPGATSDNRRFAVRRPWSTRTTKFKGSQKLDPMNIALLKTMAASNEVLPNPPSSPDV